MQRADFRCGATQREEMTHDLLQYALVNCGAIAAPLRRHCGAIAAPLRHYVEGQRLELDGIFDITRSAWKIFA